MTHSMQRSDAARRRRLDGDGALRRRVGGGGVRAREAAASGLGANNAVLPEEVPDGFDAYRAPLSALRDAKTIAVVCDEPVVERAPVVELWLKAARRAGATITYGAPDGAGRRARHRRRRHVGASRATTSTTCRAHRTAAASPTRGAPPGTASRSTRAAPLRHLGRRGRDEPGVRAMAAEAELVIGIGMFEESFRGLADLVLPSTSYLERDGTTVNLEGRLQRQRRTVPAPVPDVLAWIAKLAERFEVEVSPHVPVVFDEISRALLRRHHLRRGRRAGLAAAARSCRARRRRRSKPASKGLRLVAYRPLFSGAAVDRTPELGVPAPDGRGPALARGRERSAGSATARRSPSRRTAPRSSCAHASRATSPPGPFGSPRPTPETSTRRWR